MNCVCCLLPCRALGGRSEEIRDALYADHPDNRKLLEWKAIDALRGWSFFRGLR
jgi:hypothetical protein